MLGDVGEPQFPTNSVVAYNEFANAAVAIQIMNCASFSFLGGTGNVFIAKNHPSIEYCIFDFVNMTLIANEKILTYRDVFLGVIYQIYVIPFDP